LGQKSAHEVGEWSVTMTSPSAPVTAPSTFTESKSTAPLDPSIPRPPSTATGLTQSPSEIVPSGVPGYEILGELGRGGMGIAYKARHLGLKRVVALKMILASGHAGAEHLSRFRAEAEAVAKLQHPNIVQIYDIGEHEGRPYFSLEFVDGGSLASKLRGEPQ